MRIYFLLTHRIPDVPSLIVLKAQRLLGRTRHEVTGWIPGDRPLRMDILAPKADLHVLKSYTGLVLNYAGVLHGQRIAACNEYGACLTTRNEVTTGRLMWELRAPTPETQFTNSPQQATGLLVRGPLIIKPHRGHRGAGLHLIGKAAQLTSVQAPPGLLITQRYVPDPGEGLKVYIAGESVWVARKPFDPQSFTRFEHSAHVDEEIKDIAARTRSGSGLELLGCDVIKSPGGPRVMDVNYLPGYKGCPDLAPMITTIIDRVARGP